MKENLLQKLYVDELKDLFSAENQLVEALPKMAAAAKSPKLRAGFKKHLKQTKQHVARLEQIFKSMKEGPHGKHCTGMEGLIREGSDLIREDPDPEQLDAGLIAAAQHVEHYEMAGYGCVHTYARLLRQKRAAALLKKTYLEEKQTDKTLSRLAKGINVEALDNEESETRGRGSSD